MKKNLLKIASLLLVLAMIFSFAACKSDKDNGDSTAPSESSADANNTVSDESTPAEASSEDASAESTEIETVTDASGKVIETKPADSGKAPVVTSKGNKAPSSTADILNYYNAATKAAVSGKVGFAKHRETKNEKIEANAVVKQFKSLIYSSWASVPRTPTTKPSPRVSGIPTQTSIFSELRPSAPATSPQLPASRAARTT